jgi:hypothetical protein
VHSLVKGILISQYGVHKRPACVPVLSQINPTRTLVSYLLMPILGTFLCPPVHPSAWNNSAAIGRNLVKFYAQNFIKSVKQIQFWLKFDQNNRYSTRTPAHVYVTGLHIRDGYLYKVRAETEGRVNNLNISVQNAQLPILQQRRVDCY